MGRKNARGLALSFKPVKNGRGRGRWYKKVGGKAKYFGWGDGVTDRAGYQDALAEYHKWEGERASQSNAAARTAKVRAIQHLLSGLDHRPGTVNLDAARERVAQLVALGGSAAKFVQAANGEERRRLIDAIGTWSLDQLRDVATDQPAVAAPAKTASGLLDDFLAAQRQRMERRRKLDKLRAEGKDVKEARRENMSPGRFGRLAIAVAAFKKCVGAAAWDGTEATAARLAAKFREWSQKQMLDDKISPASFNENVQLIRQFVGWAEASYLLDRIPRNRKLFAKYQVASKPRPVPLNVLRKLWAKADDRGRAFLLLALNCGLYAADVSALRADQIVDGYLRFTRGKTGVVVKYKLWAQTRTCLDRIRPAAGPLFVGANGRPLVYYADGENGEPSRVDNVKNWFNRLCKAARLEKGSYSFGNLRDTGAGTVEAIDRSMTDLYLAHADKRTARYYVNGDHADTAPLDRVMDEMEQRLTIWEEPEPEAGDGAQAATEQAEPPARANGSRTHAPRQGRPGGRAVARTKARGSRTAPPT